jgi:hypothetical protein
MPRTGLEIETISDTHGVLLLSATYADEPFTPLVTGLITDGLGLTATFDFQGWYPTSMATVNRLPLGRETLERLVVLPAQYREGTLRRYDSLTYELYASDSIDRLPPFIRLVSADRNGDMVTFSSVVSSTTGVQRVVATYTDGQGTWRSLDLSYDPVSDRWSGSLTHTASLSFFIQAVDEDGDVAKALNKGQLYHVSPYTNNIFLPILTTH